MNSGFLSYIVLTLSFIFASFGWKAQAIGTASLRAFRWFCAAWIASVVLHWDAGGMAGTFAYAPLLVLATLGFREAAKPKPREAASAVAYGLLLGAVYSLVQLVETIDPLMIALHPFLDPLIVLWALTIGYTRSALLQLALLSLALILNDAYMALLYQRWERPYFGDRSFQDGWWAAAFALRAGTLLLAGLGNWGREGAQRWARKLRLRK
ncbi:hypothetical protein MO973_08475 [Paenibacillus sp. TRM 82003]|nr:hypothetical protein [Paenibacillus sp. TRM 82003]